MTAVGRSPLAHRHAALGARWVDPAQEWPLHFRDRDGEERAAREAAALVDWGPLDKLSLRGMRWQPSAATEPRLVNGALSVGTVGGRHAELWDIAPDEALLVVRRAGFAETASLRRNLSERGLVATDVSSGIAPLRLVGPRARDVLRELTQVDLSEAALPEGRIAFGPLANVGATIGRRDRAGAPGFTILVDRDLAEYVWDALLHAGGPHGLVVAGNAVENI